MKARITKLKILLCVLILIGVVAAAMPFLLSMNPSAGTIAKNNEWDNIIMPGLNNGQVVVIQQSTSIKNEYINGSWSAEFGQRDILIREYSGQHHSFRVPTWEGSVVLPRLFWNQWEYSCRDFGPKTLDGMLVQGEITIQCNDHDSNVPEDAMWAINGESFSEPYPELPKLLCKKRAIGKPECTIR